MASDRSGVGGGVGDGVGGGGVGCFCDVPPDTGAGTATARPGGTAALASGRRPPLPTTAAFVSTVDAFAPLLLATFGRGGGGGGDGVCRTFGAPIAESPELG